MKRILLLSFAFLTVVAFSAMAQRTVSGKITDDSGESLPGVNVVIKGTTTGTTTDLDGNYRLSVDDGTTLVFSFIGFESQEVEVGARTTIDISMGGVTELQEVVVTGYGIERASDQMVYQTDKLKADDLMQGQQQVAAAGMVGKIAGLQVNIQSNGVNPQTQILLRGLRSISQNNEAMVIIDGSVSTMGAFNDLNPGDIQDIDVLKGASAGALYGSRASNGAIIVSTKKGRLGEAFTVGLRSSLTFENVAYMPDFQTEHGIGWAGNYDAIENTNWGPRFDGQLRRVGPDFPDDYPLADQVIPYAPIKDNLIDFYETGSTFQNTVYFTGGDKDSKFYMSFGDTQTNGIVPDDEYERKTFRVNASKRMDRMELQINSTYFQDKTDVVGSSIGDQNRPLYWFVLNTPANIPLTSYKDWSNPNSYAHGDNYYNAYYQNPYWAIGTNRNTSSASRFLGNINIGYDITDRINVKGQIGINRYATLGQNLRDAQDYNSDLQPAHSAVSSFLTESESQFLEVNGNILVSGNFDVGSEFTITPIVGASFIDTDSRSSSITANNLSIPGFYDISNGTGELQGTINESTKRVYGFFADVSVSYRGWANLNIAGRQDFTSTLALEDNSYFYPSVGAGVVLTDAISALSNNPILSYAKVTASNSTVYNDLGVFALNERYSQSGFFPYGSINGFQLSGTTVDANIEKEKLNTWEFGLNLSFLKDRVSLDGAYFSTKTTNLITNTTPSVASGATSFLTNIGQLTSSGFELTLAGNILSIGDFKWNASINYSAYETVVDEIKPGLNEIAIDNFGSYGTFAIKGEAFPQVKALSYVRDDQGRVVINPNSGNPIEGLVESHGKTTPDYILGATTGFSWKGFSASTTLDYRTGHVYYAQGSDAMEFTGRSKESVSAGRRDFVFPNSSYEDESGNFVANNNITVTDGVMGFWKDTYNNIKENYVKDATALKIREIAVNYSLPKSVLASTGFVKQLTIGFVARNPWTKLPAQNRFSDPEFRNTGGNNSANGIGIGGYLQSPPTRSFGFSLNAEF